jgi:hypothetical protein
MVDRSAEESAVLLVAETPDNRLGEDLYEISEPSLR